MEVMDLNIQIIEEADRKGVIEIAKLLEADLKEEGIKITKSGKTDIIRSKVKDIFIEYYDVSVSDEKITDESKDIPEPVTQTPESTGNVTLRKGAHAKFQDKESGFIILPGETKPLPKKLTFAIQYALKKGTLIQK